MRAASEARSRSACWASSRVLASRSSMSSRAAVAASCSASSPSSPASRPATRVSSAVKSRWARSARARASSRAWLEPADLVLGRGGAGPQRVDLAVQPGQALAPVGGGALEAGDPALLLGRGVLGGLAGGDGAARAPSRCRSTSAPIACSCSRTRSASASSCSGSRPVSAGSSTVTALRTRSAARDWVPRSRSRSPVSANQVSWARASAGRSSRRAASRAASASRACAMAASTSARRSTRIVSSASSCSSAVRARTRSSAISRARASRTSAWTPAARRATSAWRPSGLSWRRISSSRSFSRVRLPSVESSLRSAFSLRLRCLRTPAASSMKPRRSSGVACRIVSSWPWPTITCISRPMPESDEQLLDVEQAARCCR